MCLCLVFTFFIQDREFESIPEANNSKTALHRVNIFHFMDFDRTAPPIKDFWSRPTVSEGVHQNKLAVYELMFIPHVKGLHNEGVAVRYLHVATNSIEGEEDASYLTFDKWSRIG